MPKENKPKRRLKTVRPSEEMKRWAVLLEDELVIWPKITVKKMFGMKTFYHGPHIFAGVPDKCGFFSSNGVIFKINAATSAQMARMRSDKRLALDFGKMQKWYNFVLSSERDLSGALEWFGEAYGSAGKLPIKKATKATHKK